MSTCVAGGEIGIIIVFSAGHASGFMLSIRLDPQREYSREELKTYTPHQRNRYLDERAAILKSDKARKTSIPAPAAQMQVEPINPEVVVIAAPPAPAPAAAAAAPAAQPDANDRAMVEIATPGVSRRRDILALRGQKPMLASYSGDRSVIVAGYKNLSLCNMITRDCIDRAYAAIPLLDENHATIIQAKLMKAGISNANASHVSQREISFKKAASIALQAERWVFQAQAAAAKSMVKENKRCQHNIAGKRRRTTEEKEATYAKKVAKGVKGYEGTRGTRKERAIRKKQKQLAKLNEEQ